MIIKEVLQAVLGEQYRLFERLLSLVLHTDVTETKGIQLATEAGSLILLSVESMNHGVYSKAD